MVKHRKKHYIKLLLKPRRRRISILVSIVVISAVGALLVMISRAATPTVSVEVESMNRTGNLSLGTGNGASGNAFVRFGGQALERGKASPGGTYADWFFSGSGLESIEWTQLPVHDPDISLTNDGLLHYYAYTFSVTNSTNNVGYGYAGFQTNGYINGYQRGRVINFSFWGSNGGKTSGPGMINANNNESGGYQIMYPFNWTVGHQYAFQLKPGPSGTDAQGKWWGLWVKNLNTDVTTFIGEERVQATIGGLNSTLIKPHTGNFGEDLHWWRSLSGQVKYLCSDFQNSSMATLNVTANNGSLRPSSFNAFTNSGAASVHPDNGYATTNCNVSTYTDTNKNVQMNLGHWAAQAPNQLPN
ncbi:hypothetical protein EKI60_06235 [Candidatus Saccharibacteria bacterium]|nr:MAG: hypothetical protein EKI60_06235 [Candidatus Saccharibacteria bacterium]